jgi:hypothetical protein
MPLAGGQLSNIPGLLHHHRAALSLILTHRQGGEVADPIYKDIVKLVGQKAAAVCAYVGRVMEYYYALSPLNPGIGLDDIGIDIFPVSQELTTEEWPSTEIVVNMPQHANPLVDAPSVGSILSGIKKTAKQSSFKEEPSLFSINLVRQMD